MTQHFDVAIVGATVASQFTGALLARRGFRVLVFGHESRPARYAFDGYALARRPFVFLAKPCPVWRRGLVELAQSQTFGRKGTEVDPMLQAFLPDRRLDVPRDATLFARELAREYGSEEQAIVRLYERLALLNGEADAAFGRDAPIPPGSFWERRESSKLSATLAALGGTSETLLDELSDEQGYRRIVVETARHASDLAGPLPSLAVSRLHGSWTRGVARLREGESELTDFAERITGYGGQVRRTSRVASIQVRRGKVAAVQASDIDEPVHVDALVFDGTMASLAALSDEAGLLERVPAKSPAAVSTQRRFVASLVVNDAGLPAPLGEECFFFPQKTDAFDVLFVQRQASGVAGTSLLVCEVRIPEGASVTSLRARIADELEGQLPFLGRHVVFCDSPHDGLPLWDFRSGARAQVERSLIRASGGSIEAEPMEPVYAVQGESYFGLSGEPIRTALGATFLVGRAILPALGQEGALLGAASCARIVTKSDRTKEKMRKEMWSKLEIG